MKFNNNPTKPILTRIIKVIDYPYNFIFKKTNDFSKSIIKEIDLKKYFLSINQNELVLVNYKGLKIIGFVKDYDLTLDTKVKACYVSKYAIRPILLSHDNVEKIIGDLRIFVVKYEEELLFIAKTLKSKCIMTLVNILNQAKESNLELNKKNLLKIKKEYNYKIQIIAHSWT